jgi:hypothetical protein
VKVVNNVELPVVGGIPWTVPADILD